MLLFPHGRLCAVRGSGAEHHRHSGDVSLWKEPGGVSLSSHLWPLWLVKVPVWLYESWITETESVVVKHEKKREGPTVGE